MIRKNELAAGRSDLPGRRVAGARGFTLVEMMLAVALSQMVLLGLVVVYANSNRYFNTLFQQHFYKQSMLYTIQTIKVDMELASRIDRPTLTSGTEGSSKLSSDQDFVLAGAINVAPDPDSCYPINANDTHTPSWFLYCVKQTSDYSLVVYKYKNALVPNTSTYGKVDCACKLICSMRATSASSFNGCGCDKNPSTFATSSYPAAIFLANRGNVLNQCGVVSLYDPVAVSTTMYTAYFSYNAATPDKVGVNLGVMKLPGAIMGNFFTDSTVSAGVNAARLPFSAELSREFKIQSYGKTPCDLATTASEITDCGK